jgi:Mrp family chromosome partitioning ATPase/capsular polysaccharide biosynthesis protein
MGALERRQAQAPSKLEPMGSSPTLLTHLGVLARRKWLVLLALVVTPVVALVITLHEKPLYQGSAQVLLSHQNLAAAVNGVADSNGALDPVRVAQTQADLARVPQIARRTLSAAGIHDRTAGDFLKASSVTTAVNADLLTFDVTDRDPAVATRLATQYARQFVAFRSELDSAAFDRARKGIERRLDQLRAAGATGSPLYIDLTAKRQQLIAIESLQTTSALLVRPADPASKVRPRPVRAAFLGGLFGLVIGIGLAFLIEAVDTRVRTGEEIEERLGLPLLARVPSPPRQLQKLGATAMLSDPAGPYAESIRTLRVRLGLAGPTSGIRVIMLTSATEGEGKSTTVANLAVALAQAGRRVVLCDLDARRPVIDRFFEARAGLIDVALGQIELEDALSVVAIPDKPYWPRQQAVNGNSGNSVRGVLEVLTFGRPPPDPAEFVGSDSVAKILERLRARADVVLVDAPSLLDVGDAVIVSSKVDALLIVTRLQVIRRSMLSEMRRVLASCPAPALGFVLTGVGVDDVYRSDRYHPQPALAESEFEPVEQ